jgi:hypothetical protein
VRGLGCYGETAAPRNAPSQPTAAKHARWPWFCELRPERSGQWLHAKVVREGHQCPELCSGSNLPVMRFSVGAGVAGDAPHSSSVWERLHPARAACSYLLTCKRIIWSVWGAAVNVIPRATTRASPLSSLFFKIDKQHDTSLYVRTNTVYSKDPYP